MSVYRTVLSYLLRKAGPVALNRKNIPLSTSWGSVNDAKFHKENYANKYQNYFNFLREHRPELNKEEHRALAAYRNDPRANAYLRGGYTEHWENELLDQQVDHISNAIARSVLKRPIVIWRGINFSEGEPITDKLTSLGLLKTLSWARGPNKAALDSLVGFKFREPAFSSTTLSPVPWSTSQIRMRILADKGQPALVTNSSYGHYGNGKFYEGSDHDYASEHEVLLNKGTVFRIESARFELHKDYFFRSQLFLNVRIVDE